MHMNDIYIFCIVILYFLHYYPVIFFVASISSYNNNILWWKMMHRSPTTCIKNKQDYLYLFEKNDATLHQFLHIIITFSVEKWCIDQLLRHYTPLDLSKLSLDHLRSLTTKTHLLWTHHYNGIFILTIEFNISPEN